MNRVTSVEHPSVYGGLTKVLGEDRFGRIVDLQWRRDDATLADGFQYTYDFGSRRVSRDRYYAPEYSENYAYDRFNQLVAMDRNNGDSQAWDLEHMGNWSIFTDNGVAQDRVHNAVNELTAISDEFDPTYDAAGNTLSVQSPEDAAERMHYRWDAWNRLAAVYDEGQSSLQRPLASYEYDAQGRRVQKAVNYFAGESTNVKSTAYSDFLYDGWNLVREKFVHGQDTDNRTYTWGLDLSGTLQGAGGVGGLIAQSSTAAGATVFTIYDANGNVGQLVDASDGSLKAEYEYDPFGGIIKSTGSAASDNPFRFSTKYFDDETGLSYYGFRYYDAEKGRWTRRDPIAEDGGENLYAALWNSPLTYVDGDGAIPIIPIVKGVTDAVKGARKLTKKKFLAWHKAELKDMAWVKKLPDCPDKLCMKSSKGTKGKTATSATVPDRPEWTKHWHAGEVTKGKGHPGHVYMIKSKAVGTHGQQCTYDAKGNLIKKAGWTAGNADRGHEKEHLGSHMTMDVVPGLTAQAFDKGGFGKYSKMYIQVRPINQGGGPTLSAVDCCENGPPLVLMFPSAVGAIL